MERPSYALMGAFCIAQLISSLIAAYANWGFTDIRSISGGWIGIIWVWVRCLVDIPNMAILIRFSCRTSYGSFLWTGSSSP